MSAGVTITVQADDLNEIAATATRLGDAATGDEIRVVMGTAVQEAVRNHLFGLASDSAHHQTAESLGADRTGFYLEAADNVHDPEIEDDGVSVSIEKAGLAQRFFGGTIQGDPYLTIPARAEAYGHRAREFDNLKLIIFPSGAGALVDKNEPADEGSVYYWLVRTVTQEADPSVLPQEQEMLDPATERALAYIERQFDRRAA